MLNRLMLIGHLGQDPIVIPLRDNVIVHFSVATTQPEYVTAKGQIVPERTTWHKINCYGSLAKSCAQYLKKGHKVYVEGTLVGKEYTDKQTGEVRQSLECEAASIEFLTPKAAAPNETDKQNEQAEIK